MITYRCLAVFTYSFEYSILRLKLEESGIRHYFQNENFANVLPMSSLALGGIQLMIHPQDFQKAKTILQSFDQDFNLTIV